MNPTQLLFKLDNYNLPTHFSKEPEKLAEVLGLRIFIFDNHLSSTFTNLLP